MRETDDGIRHAKHVILVKSWNEMSYKTVFLSNYSNFSYLTSEKLIFLHFNAVNMNIL